MRFCGSGSIRRYRTPEEGASKHIGEQSVKRALLRELRGESCCGSEYSTYAV
jgi:hypothetical protein